MSVLYLLYHRSLCNQTRYVDVKLLITEPSANEVGIDGNTDCDGITKHTTGYILPVMMTSVVCSVISGKHLELFGWVFNASKVLDFVLLSLLHD